jgi:hypothetical protein
MGTVVDKVAMGQVLLRVLWFPLTINSIMVLNAHILSGGYTIFALLAAVQ